MRPKVLHCQATIDTLKRRGLWTLTRTIAKAYGTTPPCLVGAQRLKVDVEARQALWASIYDTGLYSTVDLGRVFGRDPTTILWGVRQHQRRLSVEARVS